MTTPGLRGCAECGHEWFRVIDAELTVNGDTTHHPAALCFGDDGHVAAWGGKLVCAACSHPVPLGTLPPTPGPALTVVE